MWRSNSGKSTESCTAVRQITSVGFCSYCREVSNLSLCGPEKSAVDFHHEWAQVKWIGPSVAQVKKSALSCDLCRLIAEHLDEWFLGHTQAQPNSRIALLMVNHHGFQSDGCRAWSPGLSITSAGAAGISVFVEATPNSQQWLHPSPGRIALRIIAPKDCSDHMKAIFMRKQVDSTATATTFDRVHSWLDHCAKTHRKCRQTLTGVLLDEGHPAAAPLPNRIISMARDGTWRVMRTLGRRSRYAALSYSWGVADEQHQYRLLRSNVHRFEQENMVSDDVPKTYADVMQVCRWLGLEYLWIDALCIVQDDDEEWTREARNMGSVYQYATLTVVALASGSIHDGTAKRQAEKGCVQLPWILQSSVGDRLSASRFYVTNQLPIYISEKSGASRGLTDESKQSRWITRGWTFQEAALSRRVLFLGTLGYYCECATETFSEDQWDEKVADPLSHGLFVESLSFSDNFLGAFVDGMQDFLEPAVQSGHATRPKLAFLLHRMLKVVGTPRVLGIAKRVQVLLDKHIRSLDTAGMTYMGEYIHEYTSRTLTRPTDALVAFESFAEKFATRTQQTYLSGIWSRSVAYCLYWRPLPREISIEMTGVAPSWSWASRQCPAIFARQIDRKERVILRPGHSGDLLHLRILRFNPKVVGGRGLVPHSISVHGSTSACTRSIASCDIYPETMVYLNSMLRLIIRSGHDKSWSDKKSHLLFVEPYALESSIRSKATLKCSRCNNEVAASDEYASIQHIEACNSRKAAWKDTSQFARKLCGIAMFDDPANAPENFRCLLLSHGRVMGTRWSRKSAQEVPQSFPWGLQQTVISPGTQTGLGFSSVRSHGTSWPSAMQIYHLLSLRHDPYLDNSYVRIGIGVGFCLPGLKLFGGVNLRSKELETSVVLL